MEIASLAPAVEPIFWKHVNQDIPHYFFFAFDWKYNRETTEILLALTEDRIDGMMLLYRQSIVQLRGSREAVRALLNKLSLEKVELQAPIEHKREVLKKYKPILKQSHEMMLMTLQRGEQKPQPEHSVVNLNVSDAENIAAIMNKGDPEFWGAITSQNITEGIGKGVNWLGVKLNGELVSMGSARLTEWAGHIGIVATREGRRNRGYATSVVSELVKRIFEKLSLAMIYVLVENSPAVRAYEKVGFKSYRTYFFVRGEKR
jgi:predicted GNAT family acetyltransferase